MARLFKAGCCPGVYTKWLLERGDQVAATDANQKIHPHARRRTENRAVYYHANMEEG
jgi:2-polyprenyl-3-methyl-5-hydroxy-6-metoxy-1,4-benzoquinol methylase